VHPSKNVCGFMLVLSTREPEVKRQGITELIASWRFGLGFLLVAELPKMRFMTEADKLRVGLVDCDTAATDYLISRMCHQFDSDRQHVSTSTKGILASRSNPSGCWMI